MVEIWFIFGFNHGLFDFLYFHSDFWNAFRQLKLFRGIAIRESGIILAFDAFVIAFELKKVFLKREKMSFRDLPVELLWSVLQHLDLNEIFVLGEAVTEDAYILQKALLDIFVSVVFRVSAKVIAGRLSWRINSGDCTNHEVPYN